MRPRSKYPPQTPAQRQAKCRALKRGEQWYTLSEEQKRERGLPSIYDQQALPQPPAQPALPSPGGHTAVQFGPPPPSRPAAALPAPPKKTLPAPATGTAIQRALSGDATTLALLDASGGGDGLCLSLPPAVAARLRSLLDRHEAGKTLTAAERAEAQGLLDIAEFFVVQRLRNRLAA